MDLTQLLLKSDKFYNDVKTGDVASLATKYGQTISTMKELKLNCARIQLAKESGEAGKAALARWTE